MDSPAFCCCEFTDRHGQRSHLGDAGSCDRFLNGLCTCQPQALHTVLADFDDRLRLPQYGGAVHVGMEGSVPALLLPALAAVAVRGPLHTFAVAAAVPPAVLLLHLRMPDDQDDIVASA